MLSKNPSDIKAISAHSRDVEILRLAIIAELDAIYLYEQLAASASNKDLKTRLLHVAKEEKTHVGEFQALLLMMDAEQKEELARGQAEFEEDLARKWANTSNHGANIYNPSLILLSQFQRWLNKFLQCLI